MSIALIGKTITHQLSENWIGLEIIEENSIVSDIFKKGSVVIQNGKGEYRGLCESVEKATALAKIYGPHAYFPVTVSANQDFCVQMSQNDAIRVAEISGGNLWARPAAWKHGTALHIEKGEFQLIPTSRGGVPAHMPSVSDLLGNWEVVSPEVVLKERD